MALPCAWRAGYARLAAPPRGMVRDRRGRRVCRGSEGACLGYRRNPHTGRAGALCVAGGFVNANAIGGAVATGEPRRDNWRTPSSIIEAMIAKFGPRLWDASATGPSQWATGEGNTGDALVNQWPSDRLVFSNPPFSRMGEWASRIVRHSYPTLTLCPLRPSSAWWRLLVSVSCVRHYPARGSERWGSVGVRSVEVEQTNGAVLLILFDRRVAYLPPPGVNASSPAFDSCLILRGSAS